MCSCRKDLIRARNYYTPNYCPTPRRRTVLPSLQNLGHKVLLRAHSRRNASLVCVGATTLAVERIVQNKFLVANSARKKTWLQLNATTNSATSQSLRHFPPCYSDLRNLHFRRSRNLRRSLSSMTSRLLSVSRVSIRKATALIYILSIAPELASQHVESEYFDDSKTKNLQKQPDRLAKVPWKQNSRNNRTANFDSIRNSSFIIGCRKCFRFRGITYPKALLIIVACKPNKLFKQTNHSTQD